MKFFASGLLFFSVGFLLLASANLSANPVQKGMTLPEVHRILGEPLGETGGENFLLLTYPPGQITLRNGKVSDLRLGSREEGLARHQNYLQEQQERRARLREGIQRWEEMRASEDFQEAPADRKIIIMTELRDQYPGLRFGPYWSEIHREARLRGERDIILQEQSLQVNRSSGHSLSIRQYRSTPAIRFRSSSYRVPYCAYRNAHLHHPRTGHWSGGGFRPTQRPIIIVNP